MAIEKCTLNGKPGWKNGAGGVCHTGKLGKAKAMKDTPKAAPKAKVSKPKTEAAATVKAAPKKKAAAKKK
jgi:hypothetical protein